MLGVFGALGDASATEARTAVGPASRRRGLPVVGAALAALIALPLGIVMSAIAPWDPGRAMNLAHGVAVVAPPAAAVAGYVVAPFVMTWPARSIVAMVLMTWAAAILLFPLASIFLPLWTHEITCIGMFAGTCTLTAGMTTAEIVGTSAGLAPDLYRAALLAPLATVNQVPAMLVGAATWTVLLRRWLRLPIVPSSDRG